MTAPDEQPTLSDELFGMETGGGAARVEALGVGSAWPQVFGPVPSWQTRILAAFGFVTYAIVNLIVMWVPLHDHHVSALPQAVVLVVVAFGVGSLLAWVVGGAWRAFGFGMIGGWLALTLLSLGFLTGLS
ncbi:hypothetical protein [Actinocorallia longicatena]|uniref:Uncharacterized protein n=1 Tax=Actinocorallia longicatena TaxID=111803 RepID=A0ABP6Q8X3_9ACTN